MNPQERKDALNAGNSLWYPALIEVLCDSRDECIEASAASAAANNQPAALFNAGGSAVVNRVIELMKSFQEKG